MKTARCAPTTSAVLFLGVACLALALSGCEKAETFTGIQPPGPPLTPSPVGPPANIAGAWTGTSTVSGPSTHCENPSIQAVFEQQGSEVTATFSPKFNRCGPPHSLSGHLNGNFLTGTATGYITFLDNFYRDAPLGGVVNRDGTLSISVRATRPTYQVDMELHR